jgi:heat shock protein HslJ
MPFISLSQSLTRSALLAVLAVGLAACSTTTGHAQAQGAAATQAATTSDSLAQTNWKLVKWAAKDGALRELPRDTDPVSIAFLARNHDYRVSGFAGCNRYVGTYKLEGGKLVVTVPAASRMACGSDQMAALETAFLTGLGHVSTFTLDSGGAPRVMTLNLQNGDILTFSRGEDVPTRS